MTGDLNHFSDVRLIFYLTTSFQSFGSDSGTLSTYISIAGPALIYVFTFCPN